AVTAVNDPPKLDLIEASPASYTEGNPATTITSALTVADPDSNLTGATVAITANLTAGDELTFTDQLGITGHYDSASGVLTLSGNASAADYQTALRSVK